MGFDFSLVDVFTDRPFGGNRLAVFPYATGGTAAVLASLSDDKQFVFEEGVGPVRVDVDGESMRLYLDSPRYENSSEAPPTAEIARALSLPDDAISDSWYGPEGVSPELGASLGVPAMTAYWCSSMARPGHRCSRPF